MNNNLHPNVFNGNQIYAGNNDDGLGFNYEGMTFKQKATHYQYLVEELNYALTKSHKGIAWKKLVLKDFLFQTGFDDESYDTFCTEEKASRYESCSNED